MKRIISKKDFKYYTHMKSILFDLQLADKQYWWLISDIEAYPHKKEYRELICKDNYLLASTADLVKMLEDDDFQWIWAVFSVIPFAYSKEDILKCELPVFKDGYRGQYDPWIDPPMLQHPLAKFEIYAADSSCMIMITDDDSLLTQFKKCYPCSSEEF